MKIFLTRRERLAGLFIVATVLLVVAFFVGAAVRNRWLADKVKFHTRVSRGDGLRTGSPVLLSGIEVGEVGRMQIRDDLAIDVELVVLADHAARIRVGTRAEVRRLLGIGEKRIQLMAASPAAPVLPPGSMVPALEAVDVLEVIGDLDLSGIMKTSGRALGVVEKLMATLEEKDRFERLVGSLDRIGPTLERVDKLLDAVHAPAVALLTDPALHGTLAGAEELLADPALRKVLRHAGQALEPQRIDRFLARADQLIGRTDFLIDRVDTLTNEKSRLPSLLQNADKLLSDTRIDRLIGAIERLTDEKKLAALLDNVTILAEQSGKVGPEIPRLVKDLNITLREAVIVLKAVQKTWMLEGKADDVRKEMKEEQKAEQAPPPPK